MIGKNLYISYATLSLIKNWKFYILSHKIIYKFNKTHYLDIHQASFVIMIKDIVLQFVTDVFTPS